MVGPFWWRVPATLRPVIAVTQIAFAHRAKRMLLETHVGGPCCTAGKFAGLRPGPGTEHGAHDPVRQAIIRPERTSPSGRCRC